MANPEQNGPDLGRKYRILRKLGRGGMGEVYLIEHKRLGKRFAAKVIHELRSDDATLHIRFRREAESLAKFCHPNIVEVVDFDFDSGTPFLVMEYLEGETLKALLQRRGSLSIPEVVSIADQVLAALTAAHGKGIMHRDLKPENIFLAVDESGGTTIKLLDFGLAKVLDGADASLSVGDSGVLGTPAYMAPEQVEDHSKVGPGADLWALGAILYHMVAGSQPFKRGTLQATLMAVLGSDPEDLRIHRPDAPIELVGLISQLLIKDPERRPQSASQVREQLAGAYRGAAARANTEPPNEAWSSSRLVAIGAGVVMACVFIALVATSSGGRDEAAPAAETAPVSAPAAAATTAPATSAGGADSPPPIELEPLDESAGLAEADPVVDSGEDTPDEPIEAAEPDETTVPESEPKPEQKKASSSPRRRARKKSSTSGEKWDKEEARERASRFDPIDPF